MVGEGHKESRVTVVRLGLIDTQHTRNIRSRAKTPGDGKVKKSLLSYDLRMCCAMRIVQRRVRQTLPS